MDPMSEFLRALTLNAGYNAALVAVGAALLGAAGGAAGTFVGLRRRALATDAAAHATLPGVAAAFMLMAWLGGDGRWLPGLLAGSALSAALGMWLADRMAARTRLPEDAAIGAILSTFYGLGVVLLTVIQGMNAGKAAGLSGFLLGQTAGMLRAEALTIAAAGALAGLIAFALRRPMTLVCFDPGHAAAMGVPVRAVDLAIMGLAVGVTVIGLKIVGLVLVVALLIVPPAAARFWTDRVEAMTALAALMGAAAGWIGAALSASAQDMPAGALIVLTAFGLFALSMLAAPRRGALAALAARRAVRRRMLLRQGLAALARGAAPGDAAQLRALRRAGMIGPDGAPTARGLAAAAEVARDMRRRSFLRGGYALDAGLTEFLTRDDGLTPLERMLAPDQLAALDAAMASGGEAP